MKDKICLYIATHNITKLQYFGKTGLYFTENDLQKKYHGSGMYWKRHLKKYGDDVTMKIYGIFQSNIVSTVALKFSEENNIVKSNEWANLKEENGLDGNPIGIKLSQKTKNKIKKSRKNQIITQQQIEKRKNTMINRSDNEKLITLEKRQNTWVEKYKDENFKKKITEINKKIGNEKRRCYEIYDNNDVLRFECLGNFQKLLKENNLPINAFTNSYQNNGTRLYQTNKTFSQAKFYGYENFTGWYSLKLNK